MTSGWPPARALPAALLISLAAHAALLAALGPAAAPRAPRVEFPLQVRVAPRPETAPHLELPVRPKRSSQARRSPSPPKAAPAPAIPVESPPAPPEPLRTRVVADPEDYGERNAEKERVYAWPGLLRDLPYPMDGFGVEYPARELELGTKALVVARVEIGRSGMLERLHILCGEEPFATHVRQALVAAPFRPGIAERGPVPTWLLLEFGFFAEPGGKADMAAAERAYETLSRACVNTASARR